MQGSAVHVQIQGKFMPLMPVITLGLLQAILQLIQSEL
jgi:hypothetical protein